MVNSKWLNIGYKSKKKWENELKKKGNKFLYLHLSPGELKNKLKRKLFLDDEIFNTS